MEGVLESQKTQKDDTDGLVSKYEVIDTISRQEDFKQKDEIFAFDTETVKVKTEVYFDNLIEIKTEHSDNFENQILQIPTSKEERKKQQNLKSDKLEEKLPQLLKSKKIAKFKHTLKEVNVNHMKIKNIQIIKGERSKSNQASIADCHICEEKISVENYTFHCKEIHGINCMIKKSRKNDKICEKYLKGCFVKIQTLKIPENFSITPLYKDKKILGGKNLKECFVKIDSLKIPETILYNFP